MKLSKILRRYSIIYLEETMSYYFISLFLRTVAHNLNPNCLPKCPTDIRTFDKKLILCVVLIFCTKRRRRCSLIHLREYAVSFKLNSDLGNWHTSYEETIILLQSFHTNTT